MDLARLQLLAQPAVLARREVVVDLAVLAQPSQLAVLAPPEAVDLGVLVRLAVLVQREGLAQRRVAAELAVEEVSVEALHRWF